MRKRKILVVDDSNTVLLMEKMILSKGPYEIITASDGRDAIVKARTHRPDAILMDVVMPVLNGFEACAALRADESTRSLPVIMVTTRGEADSIELGFAHGCTDYITKPINALELLTKLKNVLPE